MRRLLPLDSYRGQITLVIIHLALPCVKLPIHLWICREDKSPASQSYLFTYLSLLRTPLRRKEKYTSSDSVNVGGASKQRKASKKISVLKKNMHKNRYFDIEFECCQGTETGTETQNPLFFLLVFFPWGTYVCGYDMQGPALEDL